MNRLEDSLAHAGGTERRDRGFTLFEASVTVIILASLTGMIVQSIRGLASTQVYTRGQARTMDLAERLVQDIAHDARYAVRVLTESAEDRAFLPYFNLKTLDVMPGNKLPLISGIGIFEPDPPDAKLTGNILIMGISAPYALVDKGARGLDSEMMRIDTFRYVIYHLSDAGQGHIDMSRWAGNRMASYADVVSISDPTEQRNALVDLHTQGIQIAWDLNAPAATAFYVISKPGDLLPVTNPTQKPVQEDPERTVSRLLTPRGVEIVANGDSTRVEVPKFAHPNTEYPHGFEVKIDGGGAGRLMLVRVVVGSRRDDRMINTAAVLRLVSIRDI